MTSNQHNIISSGFRGLVCAGLATLITASLSWTFVVSTDTLQWMGRGAMNLPEIAGLVSPHGIDGAVV